LHFPHFYEAGPPRNASSDFQIFRSVVLAVGKQYFIAIGRSQIKRVSNLLSISTGKNEGETKRERVELKWELVQPLFKLQTHTHTTYSYLLKPPASKQATKHSNQHCVALSLPSNSLTHNFRKSLHQQTISVTKSEWSPKPNINGPIATKETLSPMCRYLEAISIINGKDCCSSQT
jgi:hypothetical protein